MSATGRPDAAFATAVDSAGFVRIVARADGDALAAAGVLARALADRGTPFQVSVAPTIGERTTRATRGDATGGDATVVIGASDADVDHIDPPDRPASLAACELARELDATPDPVLALAGAFAAGVEPGAGETEQLLDAARDRGPVERRPGVAVPTDDPIDGLAHSTLLRAPWSGDPDATRDALAGIDVETPLSDEIHRRVGSLVALDAVADGSERAAHAIGRVLRPHAADGPFATIGGYADVLEATARSRPGTGVALAMGHGSHEPALDAWRDHGRAVHATLDGASTGRYDGLFVLGVEACVETAARLAAAYRSPEPAVLAVGDGEAGLAASDDRSVGDPIEAVARELDAEYDVGRRRGYLRYDRETENSTVVSAVRGAL